MNKNNIKGICQCYQCQASAVRVIQAAQKKYQQSLKTIESIPAKMDNKECVQPVKKLAK
jgi:hypothetical protein